MQNDILISLNDTKFPVLTSDSELSNYRKEINKFKILSEEEEYALAKDLYSNGNVEAAKILVTSHLRLVVSIAMGYKNYGLPMMDVISEGNIGLMQAVKKFNPDKGFRLSTYAIWWIKATIQEYILRSWSLVKISATATQKKLFFNLRKLKNQIKSEENKNLSDEENSLIAESLGVNDKDVVEMDQRLSFATVNLNDKYDYGEDDAPEIIDNLADESIGHDVMIADYQEFLSRKILLAGAMEKLQDREKEILVARRLEENPKTLEELSKIYGVSPERIRQIEAKSLEKLIKYCNNA